MKSDQTVSAESDRRWFQLHRSTWICLLLFSALFSLISIPGSVESTLPETIPLLSSSRIRKVSNAPELFSLRYQHGWPFVHYHRVSLVDQNGREQGDEQSTEGNRLKDYYEGIDKSEFRLANSRLGRLGASVDVDSPPWMDSANWSQRGVASSFSYAGLFANLGILLTALFVIALLIEKRRRSVKSFFQFGIREILIAITLVGLLLGLYSQAINKQKNTDHIVHELEYMGFEIATNNVAPAWWMKVLGHGACNVYSRPVALSLVKDSKITALDDDGIEQLAKKIHSLKHVERLSIYSMQDDGFDFLLRLSFRGDLFMSNVDLGQLERSVADLECRSLTITGVDRPIGNSLLLQILKSQIGELQLFGVQFDKAIDWRTLIDSDLRSIKIVNRDTSQRIPLEQLIALKDAGITVEQR